MNLSDYQAKAAETAGGFNRLERSFNGLASELFEFMQSIEEGSPSPSEIGDCFWFLSEMCSIHFWSLSNVIKLSVPTSLKDLFSARQKYLRGDYGFDIYADRLKGGISATWIWLEEQADHLGFDAHQIREQNIQKLAARKANGTIKGDGENR